MSYPQEEQLKVLIHDVGEMAERISRIIDLINTLEDPQVKFHYEQQYADIIDLYLIFCELLENELNAAIKYGKDNNLPTRLDYWQLLKEIQATISAFSSDF